MEDWKALYASKLTTADEAVRQIPNGSRVFFGHAANEPPVLVDALVRNYEQYKDVEIVHWVPMGKGEYCDSKMKGHLHHNAMFVGGPTRKAVQEGRADYTPFFFHQSTRFFSDGTFPIDVAMVSVTFQSELLVGGIASAGYIDRVEVCADVGQLVGGKCYVGRTYVFGYPFDMLRPGDWHYPRLLCQQPSEGGACRGGMFALGESLDIFDQS